MCQALGGIVGDDAAFLGIALLLVILREFEPVLGAIRVEADCSFVLFPGAWDIQVLGRVVVNLREREMVIGVFRIVSDRGRSFWPASDSVWRPDAAGPRRFWLFGQHQLLDDGGVCRAGTIAEREVSVAVDVGHGFAVVVAVDLGPLVPTGGGAVCARPGESAHGPCARP